MPNPHTLGAPVSDWNLVKRILKLSLAHPRRCFGVFVLQLLLLTIGLSGLGFTGLGIDYVRSHLNPQSKPPQWPPGMRAGVEEIRPHLEPFLSHPPIYFENLVPLEHWRSLAIVACIAFAIMALALIRSTLNYLYSVSISELIDREVLVGLRSQVYDKLQRLSFRFFDANASGSIINRVTGDTRAVVNFINGVMIQGIIMILSLIIYFFYMLHIHPGLTLACLASTPLLALVSIIFSRWVQPMHAKNREMVDQLVLTFSESMQGMNTVKGFSREPQELAKFQSINRAVQEQLSITYDRTSLFVPTIGALTQVNLIVLLAFGGHLVLRGELSLGTGLIVFVGLLQQFSAQVGNTATITNTIQQSLIGARRMFEILDAPVEIQSLPDAVRLHKSKGAIRFEKVSFEYNLSERKLVEVDFEVEPGQCVAILGATGSGKSTLMSLIPRFYDTTAGRILLDGHDLRKIDLQDLRRNIGLVFQESFLFSNTVAANIAFGHPGASRAQIESAARIAAAHDFIKALPQGYETILRESGVNLSGGQRQRLAIARALLLEPSILLLDDPTAAIDPETEHEIFESMNNAIAGRTTFIVAHRLSTLRRADTIIVLEAGRIVQKGTHDELIKVKGGHYLRVANLQLVDAESLSLLGPSMGGKP